MCRLAVLQRACCNQVIIPPVKRCIPLAPQRCHGLAIVRFRITAPCIYCKNYGSFGHFAKLGTGPKSRHTWYLDEEQTKRVNLAVNKLVMAAACKGYYWNFVLQIHWPITEEGVVALEYIAKEFPGELKTVILNADVDASDGKELGDLLSKMSLFSGTQTKDDTSDGGAQTEDKLRGIFGGRVSLLCATSLGLEVPDDDLVAEMERLTLIS
jgi:hypothetical protein